MDYSYSNHCVGRKTNYISIYKFYFILYCFHVWLLRIKRQLCWSVCLSLMRHRMIAVLACSTCFCHVCLPITYRIDWRTYWQTDRQTDRQTGEVTATVSEVILERPPRACASLGLASSDWCDCLNAGHSCALTSINSRRTGQTRERCRWETGGRRPHIPDRSPCSPWYTHSQNPPRDAPASSAHTNVCLSLPQSA